MISAARTRVPLREHTRVSADVDEARCAEMRFEIEAETAGEVRGRLFQVI